MQAKPSERNAKFRRLADEKVSAVLEKLNRLLLEPHILLEKPLISMVIGAAFLASGILSLLFMKNLVFFVMSLLIAAWCVYLGLHQAAGRGVHGSGGVLHRAAKKHVFRVPVYRYREWRPVHRQRPAQKENGGARLGGSLLPSVLYGRAGSGPGYVRGPLLGLGGGLMAMQIGDKS